jgi:hypothetical protein
MGALRALPVPLLLALVAAAPADGANRKVVPSLPGRQAYVCAAQSYTLSDNTNTENTQGGGTPGSFDTKGRTYCLESIRTSHENAAPGMIGLKGTRQALGRWAATGDTDVWTAAPPGPVIIKGTYRCDDSDPASWSQNGASGGNGFCVVTVSNAIKSKTPQPAKPEYACLGSQLTLFDNSNGLAVNSGGRPPVFNTYLNRGIDSYCLNSIRTYHWNDGNGVKPGKLGLRPASFGALMNPVPTRHATGSSGQNNAPDVNWQVDFAAAPPTIISGAYVCEDSNHGTWSSNEQSKTDGFCTITATPAYVTSYTLPSGFKVPTQAPPGTQPPPPAKKPGSVKCFTGTLSSMLLYPHVIKSGDPDMILLQCGVPKKDGFQGRMTPSSVFAISVACATFWTYPRPSGNPPQPVFVAYTGPPNSGCLDDQHFLPFTVHGPWRVDITAYDRNRQLPLIPATYVIYVRYAGGDPQAENTLVVQ